MGPSEQLPVESAPAVDGGVGVDLPLLPVVEYFHGARLVHLLRRGDHRGIDLDEFAEHWREFHGGVDVTHTSTALGGRTFWTQVPYTDGRPPCRS